MGKAEGRRTLQPKITASLPAQPSEASTTAQPGKPLSTAGVYASLRRSHNAALVERGYFWEPRSDGAFTLLREVPAPAGSVKVRWIGERPPDGGWRGAEDCPIPVQSKRGLINNENEKTNLAQSGGRAESDNRGRGGDSLGDAGSGIEPAGMAARPAEAEGITIFDADGTLRECLVPGQPCPSQPGEWRIIPGVERHSVWAHPRLIAIASNQGGVGLGFLEESVARQMLVELFRRLTGCEPESWQIQMCPHKPIDKCDCRKPAAGMLLAALRGADADPGKSLMVGDMESDQQAARTAGVDFQWAKIFFGEVSNDQIGEDDSGKIVDGDSGHRRVGDDARLSETQSAGAEHAVGQGVGGGEPVASQPEPAQSVASADKSVSTVLQADRADKSVDSADKSVSKVLDFSGFKARRLTSQSVADFDKKHWKRSRIKPGWLIRRLTGYSIVENEYGVQYLGVVSRKPDRMSADRTRFILADFFTWTAMAKRSMLVEERGKNARAKLG